MELQNAVLIGIICGALASGVCLIVLFTVVKRDIDKRTSGLSEYIATNVKGTNIQLLKASQVDTRQNAIIQDLKAATALVPVTGKVLDKMEAVVAKISSCE
jgi:hypothetical protein